MAVTSRDLRNMHDMNHARRVPFYLVRENLRLLLMLAAGLLALMALYLVLTSVVTWGQSALDDLRYGRPRTFHLTAEVGHGGGTREPSHFIALNLDRQVVVLDIPGGDTNNIRVLPGPYLFGAGEDLTPVTLDVNDVNTDGITDLIVQVKNEQIVYLNHDGAFSLLSEAERQEMLQQRTAR